MKQAIKKKAPKKKVTGEEVIDSMRLVVQWRTMLDYCRSKQGCTGCPYNAKQMCNKRSTEDVLKRVANVFEIFLKQKEEE